MVKWVGAKLGQMEPKAAVHTDVSLAVAELAIAAVAPGFGGVCKSCVMQRL